MDYDTFSYTLWSDYISEKIVSDAYIQKNEDFIRELTFDTYKIFRSGGITIKTAGKMLESLFDNLFRVKPSIRRIRETIKID